MTDSHLAYYANIAYSYENTHQMSPIVCIQEPDYYSRLVQAMS